MSLAPLAGSEERVCSLGRMVQFQVAAVDRAFVQITQMRVEAVIRAVRMTGCQGLMLVGVTDLPYASCWLIPIGVTD